MQVRSPSPLPAWSLVSALAACGGGIGLELTARGGYNPQAGVSLWQKMASAGSTGGGADFLSSHPTDSSRVQQIQALLPTVMPLYQATRR